jgi:hypothetical protein
VRGGGRTAVIHGDEAGHEAQSTTLALVPKPERVELLAVVCEVTFEYVVHVPGAGGGGGGGGFGPRSQIEHMPPPFWPSQSHSSLSRHKHATQRKHTAQHKQCTQISLRCLLATDHPCSRGTVQSSAARPLYSVATLAKSRWRYALPQQREVGTQSTCFQRGDR